MKRLEERVGAALITRDGRDLVLTELGAELLEHAELLVTAHDLAVDRLQRSQLEGTVHLGMNDEPDANEVANLLSRFRRRHPLIRLHVKMGQSSAIATELRRGQLDIGLIHTMAPEDADEVLWSEELQWVCGQAFQLEAGAAVPIVSFGQHCLYRPAMLKSLEAAGASHYLSFEGDSTPIVRNAIVAGFGVGIVNERSLTSECRPWTIEDLDHDLPTASMVLRVASKARTTAVRALVDEILDSNL